MMLSVKAR